jgi:hypothetical protein
MATLAAGREGIAEVPGPDRRAFACALSGEPDEAARECLAALSIAAAVKSERTTRELQRTVKALTPWATRASGHASCAKRYVRDRAAAASLR